MKTKLTRLAVSCSLVMADSGLLAQTNNTNTNSLPLIQIEKAKNLLLNRNSRVSEIAYQIGFQSLTHFNRAFKRIVGHSPTEYRGLLPVVGFGPLAGMARAKL